MGAWGGGQGHQQQRGRRGPWGDGKVLYLSEAINPTFTNVYLFVAALGLVAVRGVSLVVASGGCSLFVVYRLLIPVASLVVEHWLQGRWASGVAAQGL